MTTQSQNETISLRIFSLENQRKEEFFSIKKDFELQELEEDFDVLPEEAVKDALFYAPIRKEIEQFIIEENLSDEKYLQQINEVLGMYSLFYLNDCYVLCDVDYGNPEFIFKGGKWKSIKIKK